MINMLSRLVPVFSIVMGFLICDAAGDDQLQFETIRFHSKNGDPEKLGAYAFSPNGRYLALSFSGQFSSRPGVSVIDLPKMELVRETGHFSFYVLAFSSDSRRIFGIGSYAGTQFIDVTNGIGKELRDLPNVDGKIGINLEAKNGKLLVTQVDPKNNPTVGEQIKVGDEILAINEGEKPTLYDDSQEWKELIGSSLKDALKSMAGKPGSWLQLRLGRRGSSEPVMASVQRQWPVGSKRVIPQNGLVYALTMADDSVFQFHSADSGQASAFVSLRDIPAEGQYAISSDGRLFAAIAMLSDSKRHVVEIHDITTGRLQQSIAYDGNNFRQLRFSRDAQQLLVGSRDKIDVLDVAQGQWLSPVVLTTPEEVAEGYLVERRVPLGLPFPGGQYAVGTEVQYDKPAALALFDVAPNGTLAIASETGEIALANLGTKERTGKIGDNLVGSLPTMIGFSPSGEHLVAYAKGVLHVVGFGKQAK